MHEATARIREDGPPSERFIDLSGCFNVRDLGGYRTSDGYAVRRGLIFRADALHRLTQVGEESLDALNLATVIDLRTPAEVAQRSWKPPARWEGRLLHIPLRQQTPQWAGLTDAEAADPRLVVDHYLDTIRAGRHALGAVFSELAAPDAMPILFHCAAGKDRTGIIAALLLDLLGVPDATIAADYALSEVATTRWEDSVARGAADDTQTAWAYVPPAMLRAHPNVMLSLLEEIRHRYGAIEELISRSGVSADSLAQLRDRCREGVSPQV